MLTRDEIFAASDLPVEEVQVPEWGGSVYVRTMSGTERDSFEQEIVDARKAGQEANVRGRLAARTVSDQQGERMFLVHTPLPRVLLHLRAGMANCSRDSVRDG